MCSGLKSRSASPQSHLICRAARCLTLNAGTSFFFFFRGDLKPSRLDVLPYPPNPWTAHTAHRPLTRHTCGTPGLFWHLHILHLLKSENKNATCIREVNGQMWPVDCGDTIYVIHWLWSLVNTGITYIFLASARLDRERRCAGNKWRKSTMENCVFFLSFLAWNQLQHQTFPWL